MKTKTLVLVLSLLALTACNSNTKKETAPKTVSKDTITKVAPPKPVIPEAPYVYGIDISSYQGDEAEMMSVQKDTLGFVFCKATQGAYGKDSNFASNWSQIKKDGFIRGAYHFYMTKDDPKDQAAHFANTVGSLEATDLPPVIDFEGGGIDKSQSVAQIQSGLNIFITTLEKELGRKPIIYTNIPTANKYLNDSIYAEYALWIANYTNKNQPDVPITWQEKGWTFWQRTDKYKLDNFTDDGDVFNGTKTKLLKFIQSYQ
jgi:lysozyme